MLSERYITKIIHGPQATQQHFESMLYVCILLKFH